MQTMSHTLAIRLTDELVAWLKETSRRTGVSVRRIIRQQLESARHGGGNERFLRHAGEISGPDDLSSRKGARGMKAIADRGFIVAFSNRGARHHHRAVGLARLITEPLLTWEAVLAESWS